MTALVDDFHFGLDEARADGIDELLGDETVSAAADDENRAAECTRGGCVAHSVVPDVDVAGGDVGGDRRADVGEPVELFFAEVRREFGCAAALRIAVTTEGAERRDHLVGQLRAAERHGGEQHQAATRSACWAATSSATWVPRLWPTTITGPSIPVRMSPASAARDSSVTLRGSATDPLRVPNPGRS